MIRPLLGCSAAVVAGGLLLWQPARAADERTEMMREAARLSLTVFCHEVPAPPKNDAPMQMLAKSPQAAMFAEWLKWTAGIAELRKERCNDV